MPESEPEPEPDPEPAPDSELVPDPELELDPESMLDNFEARHFGLCCHTKQWPNNCQQQYIFKI